MLAAHVSLELNCIFTIAKCEHEMLYIHRIRWFGMVQVHQSTSINHYRWRLHLVRIKHKNKTKEKQNNTRKIAKSPTHFSCIVRRVHSVVFSTLFGPTISFNSLKCFRQSYCRHTKANTIILITRKNSKSNFPLWRKRIKYFLLFFFLFRHTKYNYFSWDDT